jgi:signal transduction histidine kinase
MDLSWLAKKTPRSAAGLKEKMHSMIQDVDKIIKSVRRIAAELRPSILDDLGLVPAIDWQLKDFQTRTGIRCQLRCDPYPPDLDRERSTAIFRIVQEALTNVVRHASASRVHIRLAYDDDSLVMTVTDNGRGMPANKLTNSGSLGLVGMNERVSRFGGELKIRSQSGKGTRLHVFLPFPGREET